MKSLKNLTLFAIILVLILTQLTSCKVFEESNTPQTVLDTYIKGLAENDEKAINSCYYLSKGDSREINENQAQILKAIFSNTTYTVTNEDNGLVKTTLTIEAEKPDYLATFKETYATIEVSNDFELLTEEEIWLNYIEYLNKTIEDSVSEKIKRELAVNFVRIGNKWYLTNDNDEFFEFIFEDIEEKEIENTPEEVINTFLSAISSCDVKQGLSCYYVSDESVDILEEIFNEVPELFEIIASNFEYDIVDCNIEGNIATVSVNCEMFDIITNLLAFADYLEEYEANNGIVDDEAFFEFFAEYFENSDVALKKGDFIVHCILIDGKWYVTSPATHTSMYKFMFGDDIVDG